MHLFVLLTDLAETLLLVDFTAVGLDLCGRNCYRQGKSSRVTMLGGVSFSAEAFETTLVCSKFAMEVF